MDGLVSAVFRLCFTCGVSLSRKRKDRHEGTVPSGFSRFPTAEGESDEEEDYEKERRKRGEGRGFTQQYPITRRHTLTRHARMEIKQCCVF